MATSDWEEIYRSFTPEEREAERARLKSQMTVFNSQSVGQRSWTVDQRELRDRLQALTRIAADASGSRQGRAHGQVDFSRVRM